MLKIMLEFKCMKRQRNNTHKMPLGSKSQEASWLLEKWMQLATVVLVQAFATLGNKKVLGGAFT